MFIGQDLIVVLLTEDDIHLAFDPMIGDGHLF